MRGSGNLAGLWWRLVCFLSIFYFGYIPTAPASVCDITGFCEKMDDAVLKFNSILEQRIGQFLDGLDKIAAKTLNEGTQQGRLLTLQAGNEISNVTAMLRGQLHDELNQQMSSVSRELLPLFIHLQRLEDSLDDISKTAVDIEDTLSLDMQRLPLTSVSVAVRRIKGFVLERGSSTYDLEIVGPDFGHDASDARTSFEAHFGGKALVPYTRQAPHTVVYRLTRDDVEPLFSTDEFVVRPFDIKIVRTEPNLFGRWIGTWIGSLSETTKSASFVQQVILLPDYVGTLTVKTTRADYEWVRDRMSPLTKVERIRHRTVFTFDVPNKSLGLKARPGEMKLSRESLQIWCKTNFQPGRKFPNGKVLADIDPIMQHGYETKAALRGRGDQPADWVVANEEIFSQFGFRIPDKEIQIGIGLQKVGGYWGRCAEDWHCPVTPAELNDNSSATTVDITGCRNMKEGLVNWGPNDTMLTQEIIGDSDVDAEWNVAVDVMSYAEKPTKVVDEPKTYPVYASQLLSIDVLSPANTSSTVTFEPKNGRTIRGVIGQDLKGGVNFVKYDPIGEQTARYTYSFKFPAAK